MHACQIHTRDFLARQALDVAACLSTWAVDWLGDEEVSCHAANADDSVEVSWLLGAAAGADGPYLLLLGDGLDALLHATSGDGSGGSERRIWAERWGLFCLTDALRRCLTLCGWAVDAEIIPVVPGQAWKPSVASTQPGGGWIWVDVAAAGVCLRLCLPAGSLPVVVTESITMPADAEALGIDKHSVTLRLQLRADRVPITDLLSLKCGDLVVVSHSAREPLQLMDTRLGQVMLHGVLGRADAFCAVRIHPASSSTDRSPP